ncbi:response regulator, partial [Myxococcota bacterium]|nr:response regulator [Myxococcota bacterium]
MRKKILIAEHEVAVAESLERRLALRGYAPMLVTGGVDALAAFDAHRPDLVVVSLTLPDDAGREICRGIRLRPLGALVPILFIGSGREEVRNVSEAIAAGADHFFRKPEGIGELLAKVATYIGPGDESASGTPEPPHAPVPDERALLDALGRADSGTPPPTPQPTSSGFFRAIRDVLATRGPGPEGGLRGEPTPAVSAPAPGPDTAAAPAGGGLTPQPTESDWAALDSLLAGEPLPAARPTVPTGDAELMRTAAAVMTGGEGARPPGAGSTPPPDPLEAEDTGAPLDRWTVGRRWTDRLDPRAHPDEEAALPEPLPLPAVGAPEAPAPDPDAVRRSTLPGERAVVVPPPALATDPARR